MTHHLSIARPYALAALRIALGLIIFSFGTAKVFGFHPGPFTPPAGSLVWIAGLIELVFGLLFLIGYQTRIVAFILAGEMAVAYFMMHFPISFFPTENGGYAAAVYSFVFLYFVFSGAGQASIDARIGNA